MTEASSTRNSEPAPRHRIRAWPLVPLALFPLAALVSYDWRAIPALNTPSLPSSNWIGALGDGFAYWGYMTFGLATWLVPFICMAGALAYVRGRRGPFAAKLLWSLLMVSATSCVLQVIGGHANEVSRAAARLNIANAGGAVGYMAMTRALSPLLSDFGSAVLAVIVLRVPAKRVALCVLLYLGLSWPIYGTMLINAMGWPTLSLPFVTLPYFPASVRAGDILFFSADPGAQLLQNLRSLWQVGFRQGPDLIWNAIDGFGTVYLCSAPLLAYGLFLTARDAVRERSAAARLLLVYWGCALLLGLLVNGVNVNRLNILFYAHILLIAAWSPSVGRRPRRCSSATGCSRGCSSRGISPPGPSGWRPCSFRTFSPRRNTPASSTPTASTSRPTPSTPAART